MLFNYHISPNMPKPDSFKFTFTANFPVCGRNFQTQSGIMLHHIGSYLLKNILKVTLLKLPMLSWSWNPNLFIVIKSSASVYPEPFNMSPWSVGGQSSASVYPDPFNMSPWSVGGWVGGFYDLWVGLGVLQHVGNDILGCTAVGILLIFFFCAILFNVLYVTVSVGWTSHPSGDSDLFASGSSRLTLRVFFFFFFFKFSFM